ncbi:MAG: VPDSG-CTERM sorting domain-containing protein [Verrucomicrobia bacterium]|nr:MAG: VPDSG-CTERM sorting domain-containing protein [Verrucomicrobiota bacterium]
MNTLIVAAIRCFLMFLLPAVAYAVSAQWDLDPISGDWNTAANWTPMGVPNGPADIATFALSNTTNVSISANTEVNGITFTAAATNPYTITASAPFTLVISGTGVTNNSGSTQHFITTVGANGEFGLIVFSDSATAGTSTMFTNNGGTVSGGTGGSTVFHGSSTAASAILVANGGSNGGAGGQIFFDEESTGGTSRVELFGNGSLDISAHAAPGVTIGSIEGDGDAFLGANNLTIGGNNLGTTFSGVIQGAAGSLTKIGTGTLDLTGANTYTGNTNVNRGALQVDGSITSNTFVTHRGTLAGTGTVDGNVVNNDFGTVRPGGVLGAPGVLTVVHNYTQTQYATLIIQIAGASPDQFSVLNVLGNANLTGFLDPMLLNGFVPTIGQTFTFLNYASLTGEFSHIKHRVFDNGLLQWSVIYEPNHAILTVESRTIVPDQSSTFLLLTLGLLSLVTYRRQLLRGQP